jgi:hypothetical protein
MDIYEVSYGTGALPAELQGTPMKHTTIVTYMWPGWLGECDTETGYFTAWELIGPNRWRRDPRVYAPPSDCIATESTQVMTVYQKRERTHWMWIPQQDQQSWRRLRPHLPVPSLTEGEPALTSPPLAEAKKSPSLLSLCKVTRPLPKHTTPMAS